MIKKRKTPPLSPKHWLQSLGELIYGGCTGRNGGFEFLLPHCEKISFNWLQLTCGVVAPQLGYYRELFQNDFLCTVTVHDAQSLCIKV
jgi:hypothetical protein